MKKARLVLIAALGLTFLVGLFALTACENAESSSVAATVNGTEIMEQDVTDTIMTMRNQSEDYSDDTIWAQTLAASGYTPEALRESVINDKAQSILLMDEAEAQGFTVDEESIEEQIAQTRVTVGADGDDELWLETLQKYGFKDEQAYRDMIVMNDLTSQLYDSFELEATDEELRQFISENPTAVEGFTLPGFEDPNAASEEEVAPQENEGTEGTDGTTEGATDTEGAGGAEGEGTDTTTEPEEIITVAPEDVDLETIPTDILDQYKDLWRQNNLGVAFQAWIEELVENADIVIFDMPEDVPYNVDMSLAESSSDDSSTSEDSTDVETTDFSSPEAIEAALAEGLVITDDVVGDGAEAVSGSTVRVHYTGTLEDGTEFDSNVEGDTPFEFTLGTGSVIKGWDAGIVGMKVGGTRTLVIPSTLAYGSTGKGSIPPDATLTFVVQLVEVVN